MTKVDVHIPIQRSAEDVFDYVSNPDNFAEFSSVVQEAHGQGDAVGKGTHLTIAAKMLGKRFDVEAEVSEFDRPTRYAFHSVGDAGFPMDSEIRLEPTGPQSCVLHGTSGTESEGFFKLADPVLTPMMRRAFRGDMENVRDLLEASR